MVGATEHMQDIKKVVERSDADRSEATVHQRVYRPWGSYESLVVGSNFKSSVDGHPGPNTLSATAPSSRRARV